jgi:serine/threonine protein kinase
MLEYLKGKEVDEHTMTRWVTQLVTGLSSMHAAGILHRDISARSFFVASPTQARLGGYKFARMPDDPRWVVAAMGMWMWSLA